MKQIIDIYDVDSIINSTDTENGLTDKEAKKRLSLYGKNIIYDCEKKNSFKYVSQMVYDPVSFLVLILGTLFLSFGNVSSAFLTFSIWTINVIVSSFAMYKAEDILYTVKSYSVPKCRVLRQGKIYMIDSRLLCVGDIVVVSAGDIVCADYKILQSQDLTVYEKDITFSDVPKEKYHCDDDNTKDLKQQHGTLFASSSVLSGFAKCVVIRCGNDTEIVSRYSYLPTVGNHNSDLFIQVKKKCRLWTMISTFIAILIFFAKLFVSPSGIFDVFCLVVALMAASMSEFLLPLSRIVLSKEIVYAATCGNSNRVIIKNAASIDKLKDVSVFVTTDETLTFENMDLVKSLKMTKIKTIVCCPKSSAFYYATKFGFSVCSKLGDLRASENSAIIYICDTIDERLQLITDLQEMNEVVGVLTTRLDSIRMLDNADVAFTYGKFKYKTNAISKIVLEKFSGQNDNQILARVSDVICEENMISASKAIACSDAVYRNVSNSMCYLLFSQILRLILTFVSLINSTPIINTTMILFSGMIIDLFCVLVITLLPPKTLKYNDIFSISSLIPIIFDALIASVSIAIPAILLLKNNVLNIESISFIGFFSLLLYAFSYAFTSIDPNHVKGARKMFVLFTAFIVVVSLIIAFCTSIGNAMKVSLSFESMIISIVSVALGSIFIFIRKKFIH